jgi:CRP/FNR family transcriptional regulator
MHYSEAVRARAERCAALRTEFGDEIGTAAFDALLTSAHVETFKADRILWHDDMPPGLVGVVSSGYLRFQRYSREGRRQILNLIVPGDIFGQETQRHAGYTLETATEAVLCCFDRRTFDRLIREDGSLRRALYRHGAQSLDRLRWLTWTIGALRPDERIAAFLLSATDFMPFAPMQDGAGILTLSISRRDIADLLSTSVETICRTLKCFERRGIIRLLDSTHVAFLDEASLAALAGREPSAREALAPVSQRAARA